MSHESETARPNMHSFEALKEVILALAPELQPVFMDWLTDHPKCGGVAATQLWLETGVPMDLSDEAELRRAYFAALHSKDTVAGIKAEYELRMLGLYGPIEEMAATVQKLVPIAAAMKWV